MSDHKASLGIAIIARNAEKTIGACLDSVVPYVEQVVVCIDETSTDATAQIARDHGAEVHENHKVSDWHECPEHGRILVQHFANARQASFGYLRKDLDFHGWIDADDVVEGGEKIPEMLAKLGPGVAGVWLSYHYAKAGDQGPTSTLFDRERFIRSSIPFHWQYRVHEILVPIGRSIESLSWSRTDDIRIVHQHIGHDTAGSARRNITLLEIDLEENENDMRAWFYLGNQWFALSEWERAAVCYERATEADNPYQLWQTLIYLSMTYEKLGDLIKCWDSAWRALKVQPKHAEPYYRLQTVCMLTGDVEGAEHWKRIGDQMPDPPFFVFRNPLDKTYNAHLVMATAYANAGLTSRAKKELESAARAIPSKEVLDGIAYHQKMEDDSQLADAYVKVLLNQGELLAKRNGLSDNVWRFGRLRDIVVPNIISHRVSTQPRIIFFCGKSAEPWAPVSINTTGIGGSETAVVQIAKRFSQDGYRVDVYNDCDYLEGEYNDVGYWGLNRITRDEHADVLVSWRNPTAHAIPIDRRLSLLWCHDLHSGAGARADMGKWDRVLGVSAWHKDYLSRIYGINHTGFVPNGVELERFNKDIKKVPFRCVYGSSPDRGLERLIELWPRIIAKEPKAELHVAYGWDTIDKYIALGHTQLAIFKSHIEKMVAMTPSIIWHGRLPQDKLAELYQESVVWAYPSDFLEVFCITAIECMAAGAIPVVSGAGVLPETVGDGGLVVVGNMYTRSWRDFYVHCLQGVLSTPAVRVPLETKARERAKTFTWDRAFDCWKEIITHMLERNRMEALV